MGNVFDVILTCPFRDHTAGTPVEVGLGGLGFEPAEDGGRLDRCVWLRLGYKLPAGMVTIDDLRDAVLALPWHRWLVPVHLQVLWQDSYSTEDDGWGGRTAPYGWNHETWEVPKR